MTNKTFISLITGLLLTGAVVAGAATGSNPPPGNTDKQMPATAGCVRLHNSLFIGRRGQEVSDLQVFLKTKGYFQGQVTGYYGPVTMSAVRSFQGEQGLSRVGLVGPQTRARITALSCGQVPENNTQGSIVVTSIKPSDVVSLPLKVAGYTYGKNGWAPFEGEVGVATLYNSAGTALSNPAPLSVGDNWMEKAMAGERLDFNVTLTKAYNAPALRGTGYLELRNSNASGMSEHDRSHRIPVRFDTKASTETMTVKIALLTDGGQSLAGYTKERGCDLVGLVDRKVPKNSAVLDAALKELFAYEKVGTTFNFIPTQKNLKFDRVTLEYGVAKIYLTGSIGPIGGMCDEPRLQAQLEETAFQFPTVKSILVYLNGNLVDWNYTAR